MKIAITAAIIAAVLILLLFLICGVIFNYLIWVTPIKVPEFIKNFFAKILSGNEMSEQYTEDALAAEAKLEKMPLEKITLTAPGGERLRGHILLPEKPNGRLVIACHGARSHGLGEFCFTAPFLYENGYTVVMPEHRGCGRSDGKFMGYGTHESKDTFIWLNYAQRRFPDYDIFLLGVSMGAATVLMMSDKLENTAVRGVIADCSYTSAWNEFSYHLKKSFKMPEFPLLYICDFYCKCIAHYSFKDASPINAVKNAARPILFIHGKSDDFVPFYMEKELYNACCAPKEMLAVDGAVHARSFYTNPSLYGKTIIDFMNKYSRIRC